LGKLQRAGKRRLRGLRRYGLGDPRGALRLNGDARRRGRGHAGAGGRGGGATDGASCAGADAAGGCVGSGVVDGCWAWAGGDMTVVAPAIATAIASELRIIVPLVLPSRPPPQYAGDFRLNSTGCVHV